MSPEVSPGKAAVNSGFFVFLVALLFPGLLYSNPSYFPFDLQRALMLAVIPPLAFLLLGVKWTSLYVLLTLGVSLFIEYDPYLKQLSYVALLLFGTYVFFRSGITAECLAICFGAIVCLSSFMVAICYLSFLDAGVTFYWLECFSFVSHARFFNHFQVASLPILLLFLASPDYHKKALVFAFIVICLSFSLANISAGRGVWISMLASVLCFSLTVGKGALPYLSRLGGACVFSWLCIYLLGHLREVGRQGFGLLSSRDMFAGSRGELWAYAWHGATERPWLGWGPYSFGANGSLPSQLPAHPHQFVLQVAYEYGLVAAIFVVVIGGFALWRLAAVVRHSKDKVAMAYFAGLFGLLVNAQYSGVFSMPVSQVMLILLFGLLLRRLSDLGWRVLVGVKRRSPSSAWYPYSVVPAVVVLAFSTAVWINVVVDYFGGSGERSWNIEHHRQGAKPRTWQNGS